MVTRNHLKVSDGGLYTCVVNNTQGSDRVTFRLDVQGKFRDWYVCILQSTAEYGDAFGAVCVGGGGRDGGGGMKNQSVRPSISLSARPFISLSPVCPSVSLRA